MFGMFSRRPASIALESEAEDFLQTHSKKSQTHRGSLALVVSVALLTFCLIVNNEVRMQSMSARLEDTYQAVDQLRDSSYTSKIRDLVGHVDPGVQMSRHQIARIIELVDQAADNLGTSTPTFLVFGFGNDSPFWASLTKGRTVFVEDNPTWFNLMHSRLTVEAYLVNYKTNVGEDYDRFTDPATWSQLVMTDLPKSVTEAQWDVVLVDAPAGHSAHNVGRFQSLYMAKQLVRPGGYIIVDDCERPVERRYSALFYGYENRIGVVTRDDQTSADHRNEQCYFKM